MSESTRDRHREPGLSIRLRLALSYAMFVVVVGIAFFVVGFLLLRFVPDENIVIFDRGTAAPNRGDLLEVFVRYTLVALVLLTVIGLAGGWFVAGIMLRPVRRITEASRLVRDGSLDHRIRLPGSQNELAELADTFDEMLDRLHDAFEVQERFAANASHELRTPLAVTSTLLDVALRSPDDQDYPRLLERLRTTNDRAVGLTESLLRLADANAVKAVMTHVALSDLVLMSIGENTTEADRRDVTITTGLEPTTVLGDAGLLAQLVTNLVQNAVRHSGKGGSAHISTRSEVQRDVVALRVESTGSIVDPDTATRLAEPFLRGAGRVADGEKGSGLGLALVERIAAVHEGSLAIEARPAGGLVITVELPAAGSKRHPAACIRQ